MFRLNYRIALIGLLILLLALPAFTAVAQGRILVGGQLQNLVAGCLRS